MTAKTSKTLELPAIRKLSDFWNVLSEETADKMERSIMDDRKRNRERRKMREAQIYGH